MGGRVPDSSLAARALACLREGDVTQPPHDHNAMRPHHRCRNIIQSAPRRLSWLVDKKQRAWHSAAAQVSHYLAPMAHVLTCTLRLHAGRHTDPRA
jgi:hypothetical protein